MDVVLRVTRIMLPFDPTTSGVTFVEGPWVLDRNMLQQYN